MKPPLKNFFAACMLLSTTSGALMAAANDRSPLSLEEVLAVSSKIDQILERDLKKQSLEPLPIVADDVFVRRSYLSIVGRIPTAEEARSFLENKSEDKRTRLIEALVASPGYDSAAFNYFADLLRLQTSREQYGLGWHVWLRKSLAEDKPWDQLVHEMLSAEGHSVDNPAVGYYLRDRGMLLDNVSNTVQVFLGHQIGCAQCHDHPFDKWTQMEYYELAAFSGGIRYNSQEARNAMNRVAAHAKKKHPQIDRALRSKDKRVRGEAQRKLYRRISGETRYLFRDFNKNEITESSQHALKLPDDYQYDDADPGEEIAPSTLFGLKVGDVAPEKRREAFADWVTSTENPYFTKVIANRLWDRTFGHGLVDPVDDWNANSVGSHPEVLRHLEEIMRDVNFRTRDFERILYHTKLFQRSVSEHEATPGTDYHFVGPQLRRMSAEELYDSFTVLAHGNTDDNINTRLEEQWKVHQQRIHDLLDLPAPKLIQAGKAAKAAEDERRKLSTRTRELRTAMNKAQNAGNQKEFNELRAQLETLRRNARRKEGAMGDMMQLVMRRYPGRQAQATHNMRASEHPTPFRANHLVRQFGGSDRNTPESAHTSASIPQALTLLNGQVANSAENRKFRIFEALAELSTAEARLEYLFLSFYSSRPTAEEKEELLPLAEDRTSIFTLARAMLTSKRYLFVQ